MSTTWFTADLHFNHTNVIKYAKRPYLNAAGEYDVQMMNEALIANHNALVAPSDHVYYLGDLSLGPHDKAIELFGRLNGIKFWIFGNHDKSLRNNPGMLKFFQWAQDFAEIKIPIPKSSKTIVLCHYAMRVWNKSHYGAWQLYGHSHNNLRDDPHALQLDVGVDAWDYKPVSFEQIQTRMAQKNFRPVDHHGARDL